VNGPPKEEGRTPHHRDRPSTHTSSHHTADTAKVTAIQPLVWIPPRDVSDLERRRDAARRLPRWCDRCGARDPLVCHCSESESPLSDNAMDAWRAAILRTLPIGPPVVPLSVLKRLWRNGGTDRELAERVWALAGGMVA
jgi:hypothetical protein